MILSPVRLVLKLVSGLVALVLLYFAVTFVQVWLASRDDAAREAQAIIVLGAAQFDGEPSPVFRARLDHAADLYERGLAPVVVVTGGRREGDRFSEAAAGAQYLAERGVPESALQRETDGANSWQSLAAAARFLDRQGIDEVLLVSSPYHSLRIDHIAGEVGLDAHVSPATDSPEGTGEQLRHMARETVAVGVGRIIGYRRLVNLDDTVDRARR